MNLRTSVMLRISLAAMLCLVSVTAIVVLQAEQAWRHAAQQRADRAAAQVGTQLQTQATLRGGMSHALGDVGELLEAGARPGQCIALLGVAGDVLQRRCVGSDRDVDEVPAWFAAFFAGRQGATQAIIVRGAIQGAVTIEPDAHQEAAEVWERVFPLLALSVVTVGSLCLLVYVGLGRALRPLQALLAGLARLEEDTPGARLAQSGSRESDRIGESFNRLAESLERRTAERDALTRRLIDFQEEERRHLARELHDEFGQCLVAVGALAASIVHSADDSCPGIATEAGRIQQLVEPMMQSLRALLLRLRPPGIEEFGLESCLRNLVADWNGRSRTRFVIDVSGDLAGLSEPAAVSLFRVVQECLTNAVKHAAATCVWVRLERGAPHPGINLTVEDDGQALPGSAPMGSGLGLSGMRERVAALGGRFEAGVRRPHGFSVQAWIPLSA